MEKKKVSWLQNISNTVNQNNRELEEKAVKITEENKMDGSQIISVLESINFKDSLLPEDVLELKGESSHETGDLEYARDLCVETLKDDKEPFNADITNIDKSLYMISVMFESAVRHGESEAAFAAKAGLINGIFNIRKRFHGIDERIRDSFLAECESYLEKYYLLISVKSAADVTRRNLEQNKRKYGEEYEKLEITKDQIAEVFLENPLLQEQIREIQDQTFSSSGTYWAPELRQFYEILVQIRISESGLYFKDFMIKTMEKQLFYYQEVSGKLEDILRVIPVPEDPDMVNKVIDLVDDLFGHGKEVDDNFAKLSSMMDQLDKRIGRSQSVSVGSNDIHRIDKTVKKLEAKKDSGKDNEQDEKPVPEDPPFHNDPKYELLEDFFDRFDSKLKNSDRSDDIDDDHFDYDTDDDDKFY